MLGFVRRVIRAVYNRYVIITDPVKYARSIGVKVGQGVKFYGMHPGMFGSEPWLIELGDNVHIVSGCNFATHDGGVLILRHRLPTLEITKPIKIGSNVYIGLNCTILPGVHVGDDVIIAAGSVVTKDVPSGSVVAGVPARVIKTVKAYEEKVVNESLGFGHLSAEEKEKKLKAHFKVDFK
ncbi:TPA: acyltransferase [Pseudomonas putida]